MIILIMIINNIWQAAQPPHILTLSDVESPQKGDPKDYYYYYYYYYYCYYYYCYYYEYYYEYYYY